MDLPRSQFCLFVHLLYYITVTINGERLVLRKDPASCAARLLVKTERNIHRHDDIGKVNAHASIGLITSDPVSEAIIARAQV